jgi:membrane protein YqaA with SNARE-associated domain
MAPFKETKASMNKTKLKIHRWVGVQTKRLQSHIDQGWYGPLIAALAAMDFFIIIVPTDGIAISSVLLRPKKWYSVALWISVGSTLGAFLLAVLVEHYGAGLIYRLFPTMIDSQSWQWTQTFFAQYGIWVVAGIGATPLMQHPSIILASLANQNLTIIAFAYFCGRIFKFLIVGYIASHMPRLIRKIWGVQEELEEVGVNIPETQP